MNYERSLMAQWDQYAQIKWAEEKGRNEGIKMAAKSLLSNGFTITQTAKLLGVAENLVQQAKNEMK